MSDFFIRVFVGAFGALIGWGISAEGVPTPTLDAAKKAISECEKTLPRNVTCELYAKPKMGEE